MAQWNSGLTGHQSLCGLCFRRLLQLPTAEYVHIVDVNRSEVVGRPLAAMLANDGAKVYSVDIDNVYIFSRGKLEEPPEKETIETLAPRADILILGVPSASYKLDVNLVKEGAIVLNV